MSQPITYVTIKKPTFAKKVWNKVRYYFYVAYNIVTKYGPKHPEYGTYTFRDTCHMMYHNRRAMAGKSWKR